MNEQEQINLILIEASAYGLKSEVEKMASRYIDDGFSPLESYKFSFNDWIKQ